MSDALPAEVGRRMNTDFLNDGVCPESFAESHAATRNGVSGVLSLFLDKTYEPPVACGQFVGEDGQKSLKFNISFAWAYSVEKRDFMLERMSVDLMP